MVFIMAVQALLFQRKPALLRRSPPMKSSNGMKKRLGSARSVAWQAGAARIFQSQSAATSDAASRIGPLRTRKGQKMKIGKFHAEDG